MKAWLAGWMFLASAQVGAQALQPVQGQREGTQERGEDRQEPKSEVLDRWRYLRFEVEKVHPEVSVGLVKRWVFRDTFPPDLLAKVKQNPRLKPSRFPFSPQLEGEGQTDSGYMRWPPREREGKNTAALLWYLNGERKELAVNVDLELDHRVGEGSTSFRQSFDELEALVDLSNSQLLAVVYSGIQLPDRIDSPPDVEVESTLHVSFSGSLTDGSSRSVRSADHLLSGEITNALGSLGQVDFSNESHYGITLGWLGYEHLHHTLAFLNVGGEQNVDFLYTISGDAFPLGLVRRQLQEDGWPLVLRGVEHIGYSEGRVSVFRRVEYSLSKKRGSR